jgi:hypothetical protein
MVSDEAMKESEENQATNELDDLKSI